MQLGSWSSRSVNTPSYPKLSDIVLKKKVNSKKQGEIKSILLSIGWPCPVIQPFWSYACETTSAMPKGKWTFYQDESSRYYVNTNTEVMLGVLMMAKKHILASLAGILLERIRWRSKLPCTLCRPGISLKDTGKRLTQQKYKPVSLVDVCASEWWVATLQPLAQQPLLRSQSWKPIHC